VRDGTKPRGYRLPVARARQLRVIIGLPCLDMSEEGQIAQTASGIHSLYGLFSGNRAEPPFFIVLFIEL